MNPPTFSDTSAEEERGFIRDCLQVPEQEAANLHFLIESALGGKPEIKEIMGRGVSGEISPEEFNRLFDDWMCSAEEEA